MQIRVACYSKKGNTLKVAESISKALDVVPDKIPLAFPYEGVQLLFLGGAVYGSKLDEKLINFISTLTPKKVKKVAVFGTYLKETVICDKIKELVRNQGVQVVDECYLCKGKAFLFFNRKHPNSEELEAAAEFAKSVVKSIAQ